MDPATIQGVTRRLKARRLVAVRPDPTDRRRSLLRLTDAGARSLEAVLVEARAGVHGLERPADAALQL